MASVVNRTALAFELSFALWLPCTRNRVVVQTRLHSRFGRISHELGALRGALLDLDRPLPSPDQGLSGSISGALREQVTTRTAWALREVIGAVLVAAEANGALGSCGIVVTAVAQVARPMLLLRVQARQLFHLVAGRARRNTRDASRTVRAMTSPAASTQLSVRALLLGAVTIRTRLERGEPHVRLMTIGANLVPFWRGLLFGTMTSTAGCRLFARVRLVTADAARVPLLDEPGFTLMAVIAADFVGLGVMRQTLVAIGAGLVSLVE